MIQLQNVTKFYLTRTGPRYVLKNVSLVIPDRSNLAVLGPNGAGKSTFLRLIGGAETPNSGRITSDVSISWPLGISSGFQGSLSGKSNVLFVCKINGLSLKWSRKVVEDVRKFAELGEYFDMPVSSYSSGMRARLSFGLSMAFSFDVYLIDELTSVGDASFRRKATEAFHELKSRASLIYVSHSLASLRQTCESALFLRGGEATFYPEIEDGIKAYLHYCNEHEETGNPARKQTAKKVKVAKAASKVARKHPVKNASKLATKLATKNVGNAAGKAPANTPPPSGVGAAAQGPGPGIEPNLRTSRKSARKIPLRKRAKNKMPANGAVAANPPANSA